mmetsp:Transcript_11090/g.14501  ORF Transcript_11090/g.14501 Transcript_11090/m.14501 type:complete len:156 (-) Transcript_11090:1186-1653(-)
MKKIATFLIIALYSILNAEALEGSYPVEENNVDGSLNHDNTQIKLTLCPASGCSSENPECKSYVTPIGTCFNGQTMFPGDLSWGEVDVLDEVKGPIVHRSFYASTDASCKGSPTDEFRLALNQCVGPFGDPLPWGTFQLDKSDHTVEAVTSYLRR